MIGQLLCFVLFMISILFFRSLRLCCNYNSSQGCSREDCDFIHICRFFLADAQGNKHPKVCPQNLDHHFQSVNTRRYLMRKGLESFKEFELRNLFAATHPKVCVDFNKKRGCESEDCGQLHICNSVFVGSCSPDCDKVIHSYECCVGFVIDLFGRFLVKLLHLF